MQLFSHNEKCRLSRLGNTKRDMAIQKKTNVIITRVNCNGIPFFSRRTLSGGSSIVMLVVLWILLILQPATFAKEDSSHNKIRHLRSFGHLNRLDGSPLEKKASSSRSSFSTATSFSKENLREGSRCLVDRYGKTLKGPDEPKYFYYHDTELSIGILVSQRLTHKLASNVLKVFVEEILGYVNVTLVNMADPSQGFDPDTQFSYISSCTDPKYVLFNGWTNFDLFSAQTFKLLGLLYSIFSFLAVVIWIKRISYLLLGQ